MAEAEKRSNGSDSSPIKLPSFIPKLFPFLNPKPPPPAAANDANGSKPTRRISGDEVPKNTTYDVVSFPYNPPKNTEPLKFEAEVSSGTTSNSLILWQVYALGGFLVLKWVWARWNERNERSGRKETTDDDDQPSHREDDDDDQPSSEHED